MADAANGTDETMKDNMTLRLKASDGHIEEVKADIANYITYVKSMGEDTTFKDGMEIPMSQVDGEVLKKVVKYCEYLKDVENMKYTAAQCDEWEKDFITVEMGVLFEMIRASNFLDIQPMFDLTCKTVADMMKGKSPEEITKTFAIPN